MSILFRPAIIKNMTLRNRFVRSATYDSCGEVGGHVSEKQINLYAELARGGVGLIITGLTYVHDSGQSAPFQNSIASDDFISGFQKLTASVHDLKSQIAIQLFHAGREGAKFLRTQNKEAVAPSFIPDDPFFDETYRSMNEDEIWDIIGAFGDAARRAREAGFDAVQIHGAHGKLLSQFLSPFTNQRDDRWGGSLEGRLRLHREIYQNIRRKVGDDFPVLVKIGVEDGFEGGLDFREGKKSAQLLAQWGVDALEVSIGLRGAWYEETEFRKIKKLDQEGYYRKWCAALKDQVDVPVMMVGGLRSFELMEEIILNNEADFISMSRPFILEPSIVNDWKRGNYRRPKCISCNQCVEACIRGEQLQCFQLKERKGVG